MKVLTVEELASQIGAQVVGDAAVKVRDVQPLEAAGADSVSFAADKSLLGRVKRSKATAVIVPEAMEGVEKCQLVVASVEKALIETLKIFAPEVEYAGEGVDESAKVADSAKLGKGVRVGAAAVIAENVEVGDNSFIGAGCKIGTGVRIGSNCRLDANVVIYHNCQIGNYGVIQANSTIGATGFGYYFVEGAHRLIPHNGTVVIEDYVEIGANSCIDRGKFGPTRIGAGTKIDNLVQIAHNVQIGKCCLIAGQAGIGGSTCIGDGVVFGGRAGVVDNVRVGDGVIIGSTSCAIGSVEAGARLYGTPAMDAKEYMKVEAMKRRLPKYAAQLKELRKRIEQIETSANDKY